MLHKRKNIYRGVTLIELLIVVAIISILTASVGHIFSNIFRGRAELNETLEIQQSANFFMETIAKDTVDASSVSLKKNLLIINKKTPGARDLIIKYSLENKNLIRYTESIKNKNRHLISSDIKEISFKREKNLLHVKIILERKRYRKIFRKEYETFFSIKEFI
jgi:prepilin-type N-terminal cleavage/methylation domain-containing protein